MRLSELDGVGEIHLTHFFVNNVPGLRCFRTPEVATTRRSALRLDGRYGARASLATTRIGSAEIKPGVMVCNSFEWTHAVSAKSDNTELQEAIKSMFCWYCDAATSYAYLADVSTLPSTLLTIQSGS